MPYQPPSVAELNELITGLKEYYPKEKNPLRYNFIQQMDAARDLKTDNAYYILLGCCLFFFDEIEQEYNSRFTVVNPELKSYHFFTTGSSVYTLLKKGLKITAKNSPDYKTRIIYLQHFLEFSIKKESSDKVELIKKNITRLLRHLDPEITLLLQRQPTQEALLKSFSQIPEEYKIHCQRSSTWFSSFGFGRKNSCNSDIIFLTLLDQECHFSKEDKSQGESLISLDYTIRCGALLYYIRHINSVNNWLYNNCMDILNIKKLSNIDLLLQKKYYADLKSYLLGILTQPKELRRWELMGLDKAKDFFHEMENKLSEYDHLLSETDTPGFCTTRLQKITEYGTEYGVSVMVGQAALSVISRYGFEGAMSAIPYYTVSALRPEYALAAFLVGTFLKGQIVSTIAGPVNTVVFKVLNAPIIVAYKSAEGLMSLIKKINSSGELVDDNSNDDWVRALLQLPDDLVSVQQKKVIRQVVSLPDVRLDELAESFVWVEQSPLSAIL